MAKIDLMPREFRCLVHEYGAGVRPLMARGASAAEIKDYFEGVRRVRTVALLEE